ncbi:MAG: CinA family nicotinamide mononucleotide deamidase-related protein [Alphaproteobacteria bacterium]|nr:CinA family nicotinamide mononucleotide deamidase-related protein [Alphaproteobacteria bacterium]
MRIEILCTGDEILTGKTINTNHSHMARRLGEVGLTMHWGTIVGDDRASLVEAFKLAAKRADAVIVNGGLGPTVDDLSQEVAAEAAGVDLVLHEVWLANMEDFYTRRGRTMPPNNKKQAMLPEGAEFIHNPIGTACGFAIDIDGARFFFTPGVPREMRRMIDEQVIPRLLDMSGLKVVTRLKRFHSFGVGESRADQMLLGIEDLAPAGTVKLGFQAHYPQLETKLAAQAASEAELDALLAPVEAAVREKLGNFIIAEDDHSLEGMVIDALVAAGGSLATAEMFTSGAIAARFAPKEGAKTPYLRGVVSHDLSQMCKAVGLDVKTTDQGLVAPTAAAIAVALREQSAATHALAVLINLDNGADKIEFGGTINVGIADKNGTVTRTARILGGRDWVRLGATELAIDCLRRHLQGLPVDEQIDFEKR